LTHDDVAIFCLQLPGAREDVKWGGVRVFSVAENKMFATLNLAGPSLCFKVDKELFLSHVDRPGVRPAPYLARASWVSVEWPFSLSANELQALLQGSHQLVASKLPKRVRVGLLL